MVSAGRKIEFVFNQPWDLIVNSADLTDSATRSVAKFRAKIDDCTCVLVLLDKIRTYYQQNPPN
jgi:hypothetical protein